MRCSSTPEFETRMEATTMNMRRIDSTIHSFSDHEVAHEPIAKVFSEKNLSNFILQAAFSQDKSIREELIHMLQPILEETDLHKSEFVFSELTLALISSCESCGMSSLKQIAGLFEELANLFSVSVKDKFTYYAIEKSINSDDPRPRCFAAMAMKLVENESGTHAWVSKLSRDSSTEVRTELVICLPNVAITEAFKRTTLESLCSDSQPAVRRAAASVLGIIMPDRADLYNQLLANPLTCKAAIKSIKQIVIACGLTPIYPTLVSSFSNLTDDAAAIAFLNIARSARPEEHDLLIDCAIRVRGSKVFQDHLHLLSQQFTNKSEFVRFLDPTGISNWRNRLALLTKCLDYLDYPIDGLVIKFSKDDTGIVRVASEKLWVELIKRHFCHIESLMKLMECGWQQRLVVAKVVVKVGVEHFPRSLVEALANDRTENVRTAMVKRQ